MKAQWNRLAMIIVHLVFSTFKIIGEMKLDKLYVAYKNARLVRPNVPFKLLCKLTVVRYADMKKKLLAQSTSKFLECSLTLAFVFSLSVLSMVISALKQVLRQCFPLSCYLWGLAIPPSTNAASHHRLNRIIMLSWLTRYSCALKRSFSLWEYQTIDHHYFLLLISMYGFSFLHCSMLSEVNTSVYHWVTDCRLHYTRLYISDRIYIIVP